MARKLKPVPNRHIREALEARHAQDLDGDGSSGGVRH
jgi:hypothetical protein